MTMHAVTSLIGALAFLASPLAAQETYTRISAAVELQDGSVVVLDSREREVWLVRETLDHQERLVTSGAGPGEARSPMWLVPGPDRASVVFWDAAQTRLTRCTPTAKPRCVTVTMPEAQPPALQLLGVDGAGRTYHTLGPRGANDSATILRLDKSAEAMEEVGSLEWTPQFVVVRTIERPGMIQNNRFSMPVPMLSGDQIAILPNGEIVALPGYGKELVHQSGGKVRRVPLSPGRAQQPVLDAERDSVLRWADSSKMGESVRKVMPASKRAFRAGSLHLSPNNNLWIAYYEAGKSTRRRYDAYALSGKRIGEVDVALTCRIVGVGKKRYYTACADEDDLETLNATPLPSWEK